MRESSERKSLYNEERSKASRDELVFSVGSERIVNVAFEISSTRPSARRARVHHKSQNPRPVVERTPFCLSNIVN